MVDKLSKDELKEMLDSNEDFLFFDVRKYSSYLQKHIKGAKSLPVEDIEKEASKFDKSKLIVVYCGGYTCPLSGYAWEKLSELGFKVKAYEGGIEEWEKENLPIET